VDLVVDVIANVVAFVFADVVVIADAPPGLFFPVSDLSTGGGVSVTA
jgi:hypothetical protein